MNADLYYQLALTFVPGIGDITAKTLIAYCGSAKEVFRLPKSRLNKIQGIGNKTIEAIAGFKDFNRVEEEIDFASKHNIRIISSYDESYPTRLKNCVDSPLIIHYKGQANLDSKKIIGIVGTRKASSYGKRFCSELVEGLACHNVLIISGLAYGIDIEAHKAAIKNNIPTVAVLAHGLDRIYPAAHRNIAGKMIEQGALLTEFPSQTIPDRENFPKRNRIVAGLVDALIVLESGMRGGAMITANIANSYDREVFALPGDIYKESSKGCNQLILTHKSALLNSTEELLAAMGWEEAEKVKQRPQMNLFLDLNEKERQIYDLINVSGLISIDEITRKVYLTTDVIASILLNLEFKGLLISKPGKLYQISNG